MSDAYAWVSPLEAADARWFGGDRRGAVRDWRALAEQGADRLDAPIAGAYALEIMLRVRLLPLSGSLAPLWLERPLTQAMRGCMEQEPDIRWCRLAEADYDLWMPSVAGADRTRVAGDLADLRGWAPAELRLARLSGQPSNNPWPGTWVLGWGVSVAPGAGLGVGLHFVHPDLGFAGHRLSLDAAGDSLGGFWGQAAFAERAGSRSLVARVAGGRVAGTVWDADDDAFGYRLSTVQAAAGLARTEGAWVVSGGGSFRWDAVVTAAEVNDTGGPSAGPWMSVRWSGLVDARVSGEVHAVDAGAWALGTVDVRDALPLGKGVIASRLAGALATDGAFYRLPSAGGASLVRGAPAGRWRGPALSSAQIELRQPLFGPVRGAVFADAAWVGDGRALDLAQVHGSVGVGVRLGLPPAELNTTRLDVGVYPMDGKLGWGTVLAWGEAF